LGDPLELALVSGQNIALRSEEFRSLECEVIAFPLSAVRPGSGTYIIRKLQGGLGFQNKMTDRGLIAGTKFRVEEEYPYRLFLLPDGPSCTVGRGEAKKLLLELMDRKHSGDMEG
jgi:Fe2+ transport system protein FeoA